MLRVLRPVAESARSRRRQTGCRTHCSQEVAGGMDVHFVSDEAIEQHPVGELEQLLARDDGLVWVDIPVCDQEARGEPEVSRHPPVLVDQSTEDVATAQLMKLRCARCSTAHRRDGRVLAEAAVRTMPVVVLGIDP